LADWGELTVMTGHDIAHQRLHNQRLSGIPLGTPPEVVGWLGAVQAQDYAGAKWALRLRMRQGRNDQIDQALAQGSILRTHVLRPTWHFVSPADIRWMLALSAPQVLAASAYMIRQVGLEAATIKRCHAVLEKALAGGVQLTRLELRQALENAGIETGNGLRMAYIMMGAELEGLICSGGRRGKQFTYALLEERAPHARTLSRQEALAELARRYFLSRGPATLQDFARWSGLTLADARGGLEDVKAELDEEVVDGRHYWLAASTPAEEQGSPLVHLLSIYDEYISGYKDRRAIADREVSAILSGMGNALHYLIVVDGVIVGTWRRELTKSAAVVETTLFRKLARSEDQALAEAFQRYGEFLELPVVI